MDIELMKSIVTECDLNKTAYVFKKVTDNVPSWEDFITHLDVEFHSPETQISNQPDQETMIGGVCLRNHFYMSVKAPRPDRYPGLNEIVELFDELLDVNGHPVSAFINFVGGEKPIQMHRDKRDSVYWQCQGTTEWKIAEDEESEILSFLLEPGDVIYVPKGVLHSVVADKPRTAITLAYNPDPYEVYYA